MSAPVKTITNGAIGTRVLAQKLMSEGLQPVAIAALVRVYASMSITGGFVKVQVLG